MTRESTPVAVKTAAPDELVYYTRLEKNAGPGRRPLVVLVPALDVGTIEQGGDYQSVTLHLLDGTASKILQVNGDPDTIAALIEEGKRRASQNLTVALMNQKHRATMIRDIASQCMAAVRKDVPKLVDEYVSTIVPAAVKGALESMVGGEAEPEPNPPKKTKGKKETVGV